MEDKKPIRYGLMCGRSLHAFNEGSDADLAAKEVFGKLESVLTSIQLFLPEVTGIIFPYNGNKYAMFDGVENIIDIDRM